MFKPLFYISLFIMVMDGAVWPEEAPHPHTKKREKIRKICFDTSRVGFSRSAPFFPLILEVGIDLWISEILFFIYVVHSYTISTLKISKLNFSLYLNTSFCSTIPHESHRSFHRTLVR